MTDEYKPDSVLLSPHWLGGIVHLHAWSLLSPIAQKLIIGARDGRHLITSFDAKSRRIILAEALLLVRAVGYLNASTLIDQQLPVPFVGNLRCFVQREIGKAEKQLRICKFGTTVSRAIFLASDLFETKRPELVRPCISISEEVAVAAAVVPPAMANISGAAAVEIELSSPGCEASMVVTDLLSRNDISEIDKGAIFEAIVSAESDNLLLRIKVCQQRPCVVQHETQISKRSKIAPTELLPADSKDHFPVGSVVRVRADTWPGQSPRNATGYLARVIGRKSDDSYYVVPLIDGHRKRAVSTSRLELACMDGVDSLSRNGKSSAQASKRVAKAENDARLAHAAHKKAKAAGIKLIKDALTAAIRQQKKAAEDLQLAERIAAKRLSRANRCSQVQIKEARTARFRAIVEAKRAAQLNHEETNVIAKSMRVASLLGRRQLAKAVWLSRKHKREAAYINGSKIAVILRAAKAEGAKLDKKVAEANSAYAAERAKRVSAVRLEERRGREKLRDLVDDSDRKKQRLELQLDAQQRHGEAKSARARIKIEELEALAEKLRLLKNEALKRARLAERKLLLARNARLKNDIFLSKCSLGRLSPLLRKRVEGFIEDTTVAEEKAERLQLKVDDLESAARLMRPIIGKESAFGRGLTAVPPESVRAAPFVSDAPPGGAQESRPRPQLWQMLGRAGQDYSQDIIELGMTLMAANLSAEKAVDVMRAFLRLEYPDKVESVDYRMPDASRFREWRRYLEPICHYVALSVIKVASRTHVAHDATTKNGIHVLQTAFRCELVDDDGEVFIVDVPLKFEVCPSGEAVHEAKHVEEALHSTLCGGLHGTLLTTSSAISDNAARATSREIEKLKAAEYERVVKLVKEHMAEHPADMQPAIDAYLAMTPEQREHASELHELGCTSHSLNLTTDDCWKQSEKAALESCMVRDRAARIIQRLFNARIIKQIGKIEGDEVAVLRLRKLTKVIFKGYMASSPAFCSGWKKVGDKLVDRKALSLIPAGRHLDGKSDIPDVQAVLHSTSKAFACGGDDAAYYLNERRKLVRYAKTHDGCFLVALPSFKGSRQSINVTLPTKVLQNVRTYVLYMDSVRVESIPNQLIANCWDGLRDNYCLAAFRARSFIDVAFNAPMVFFTKSLAVNRSQIRGIMDCGEAFIRQLCALSTSALTVAPKLDSLAESIIAVYPELIPAYSSWWTSEREDLTRGYSVSTDKDFWPHVCLLLSSGGPFMLATHKRNIDKDCTGIDELRNAPINTDFVESGFSHLDTAVGDKSISASIGTAQATKMRAFLSPGRNAKDAKKVGERASKVPAEQKVAADAKLRAWDTTNFFSLARERRWAIIKDVQRNFDRLCRIEPALRLAVHDDAGVARNMESRQKEIEKALNRAARFVQFDSVVPIVTIEGLTALKVSHLDDVKEYIEALRDQIRLRMHVFGIAKKELPAIGGDDTANLRATEASRLELALRDVVTKKLPPKARPTAYPVRNAHVAPSQQAISLDVLHLVEVSKAWEKLSRLTTAGVFCAKRSRRPVRRMARLAVPVGDAVEAAIELPQLPVLAAIQPPLECNWREAAPRRIAQADASLIGHFFVEDDAQWRVINVAYSEYYGCVGAWYYDVALAATDSQTHRMLKDSLNSSLTTGCAMPNYVVFADVEQIRTWVRGDSGDDDSD